MTILILGILLWWGAHLLKRLAPDLRARLGDKGKGAIALILFASIVLMVIGYRMVDAYDISVPPSPLRHLNNLLMLIAIFMMSPAPKRGALLHGMRHPMLMGVGLWALAHLMVNWDAASFVLFGSMLVWAVVEIKVINRAVPNWTPGPKGTLSKDAMFAVGSVVLLAVVGMVHSFVGPMPFGG